jgi:hypothetical protein
MPNVVGNILEPAVYKISCKGFGFRQYVLPVIPIFSDNGCLALSG